MGVIQNLCHSPDFQSSALPTEQPDKLGWLSAIQMMGLRPLLSIRMKGAGDLVTCGAPIYMYTCTVLCTSLQAASCSSFAIVKNWQRRMRSSSTWLCRSVLPWPALRATASSTGTWYASWDSRDRTPLIQTPIGKELVNEVSRLQGLKLICGKRCFLTQHCVPWFHYSYCRFLWPIYNVLALFAHCTKSVSGSNLGRDNSLFYKLFLRVSTTLVVHGAHKC